ncbi:MAG: M48 family metallopeptidase [Candidatus Pacebacteria bacterium]|nr:M48 family metallopeptidase [Candidatus Paceibacterota bacterium]MDD3729308.1 M48 family metallopeptidase [Candidatus Paceibacterota bacterium]MDD4201824.1 M48 family metallopeptidase [Candidatus Paceibacterota bacterium]MDD4897644.1 M48 family metallopeptidase [Candidatus Paceibacterota bacterium]MDD5446196.1 M48 family metallopeptidase [Candidatus Paceibacterota bacterium]
MAANLYKQSEINIYKTWGYMTLFFIFVIAVGWIASYFFESYLILWIALIYSVLASFFGYWYSDKIVLKMVNAKMIEKNDNPELYLLVENLCIGAGLPLPKIYIIEENQPNAFATGRNPEHGVIAVTRGLIEVLDRSELEGVIAHELAHIGNRDALLQTIVVILFGVVVFTADIFIRSVFWGGISKRDEKGGGLIIIAAIFFAFFAGLCAQLMKLAISRKREYLADSSGALLTRYPEGLAKALIKISNNPSIMKKASNSTSHLFIINPFKGEEKKSFFHALFLTHPPVEKRVKALRGMNI